MSVGALKKNVHNIVRELIEQGYTDIQIKLQSHDIYVITWK